MDIVLNNLCDVIVNGWPEKGQDLSPELHEYWNFYDELSIENVIIIRAAKS